MPRPTQQQSVTPVEGLLNPRDVQAKCRIAKTTLRRLIAQGRFPRPLMLSRRSPRWRSTDIEAHLARLVHRASRRGQP